MGATSTMSTRETAPPSPRAALSSIPSTSPGYLPPINPSPMHLLADCVFSYQRKEARLFVAVTIESDTVDYPDLFW